MEQFSSLMISTANKADINLKDEQIERFYQYYNLLVQWNEKINLTAITEMKEVIIKHFIDSILVLKAIPDIKVAKILDIGTGAGFPGLPLKIMEPTLEVVLMDSLRKRVDFLNLVINELSLTSITAIHGRAEEVGKNPDHREGYDFVFSRAVARLNILSEYCLPFVKVGGKFIALKGPKAEEEVSEAENALNQLGGVFAEGFQIQLPVVNDQRNILVINKTQATPTKYPRKAGVPDKRPL